MLDNKSLKSWQDKTGQHAGDEPMVEAAVRLVHSEYSDIVRTWNSIGLAPEKKHEEALLLHQEIEELFHVLKRASAPFLASLLFSDYLFLSLFYFLQYLLFSHTKNWPLTQYSADGLVLLSSRRKWSRRSPHCRLL